MSELYLQIIGCVLLTAFTVPVICVAIWAVVLTYNDFIERRDLKRWKKRTTGDK
jgi:hypothetical protein